MDGSRVQSSSQSGTFNASTESKARERPAPLGVQRIDVLPVIQSEQKPIELRKHCSIFVLALSRWGYALLFVYWMHIKPLGMRITCNTQNPRNNELSKHSNVNERR